MNASTKRDKTKKRVRKYRQLKTVIAKELQNFRYSSSSSESSSLENHSDPDDSPSNERLPQYDCETIVEQLEVYQGDQNAVSENESLGDTANIDDQGMESAALSEENDPVLAAVLENDTSDQEPIRDEAELLKEWALDCNISHVKLDKLLTILRRRLIPSLPASSKTFLKTAEAQYKIRPMHSKGISDKGEFVYFGIEKGLKLCFNEKLHADKIIELQFNVDGVPLFESSMQQFWPILCRIHNKIDIYKPFVVAIYSGESKPPIEEYLEEFIEELSALHTNGIQIAGERYDVQTKCFICDTPARAFLKCIKGHGGYSACERCTVYGDRIDRKIVYPDINCPERTDESFRNLEDPEHHMGVSPLTRIEPPVDTVKVFLLDFMHLTGVMKRLLVDIWVAGDLRVRLGQAAKNELSRRLLSLKSQIPIEFQRKIRPIRLVRSWKATEFRFFLLYCGPIVLQHILPKNLYDHFLLLHAGCRILCDEKLAITYNEQAKIYLRSFVQMIPILYNRSSAVINMHNLIHLADDVKNMDCTLSKITAFPFENKLGKIKNIVRTPNRPLAQVCRRLHETNSVDNILKKSQVSLPKTVTILKESSTDDYGNVSVSKIECKFGTLTTSMPNNFVLLKDGSIVRIKNIFYSSDSVENIHIVGVPWKRHKDIFEYPTSSSDLYMWELSAKPSTKLVRFIIDSVQRKVFMMSSRLNPKGRVRHYASALTHN